MRIDMGGWVYDNEGNCPTCGKSVALTATGRIWRHSPSSVAGYFDPAVSFGGMGRYQPRFCRGSGGQPADAAVHEEVETTAVADA